MQKRILLPSGLKKFPKRIKTAEAAETAEPEAAETAEPEAAETARMKEEAKAEEEGEE